MDPAKRIASLWDWLPTFRTTAEAGTVTEAAKRLGVSPSAVSRTVRLLEDDLHRQLFNRSGRRIELNAAGETMLAAVRDAMRTVDEAWRLIEDQRLVGPVRIATVEPVTSRYLVPAVEQLRRDNLGLVPELTACPLSEVIPALHRGSIDVAFVHDPVPRRRVTVRRLGALEQGLYAGSNHALDGADEATDKVQSGSGRLPSGVRDPSFVALSKDLRGLPRDGWPTGRDRFIACYVNELSVAMEMCKRGRLLAVLPNEMVREDVEAGGLRRIPCQGLTPLVMFAVWRENLSHSTAAETVINAVQQQVDGRS